MFVKICGVRDLEELEIVERYADATGVVVECESKRRISLEKAKEIIKCSSIPVFIVSTLKSFEDWVRVVEFINADYVQIHTDVSPSTVERIKELGVKVSKAFKVSRFSENPEREAEMLIREISNYDADYILLDTGKGCGITHDHRVSKIVAREYDVILAGGLNPENVKDIVDFVKPWGVDVSSGVEKDGRKDEKLIVKFVRRVRV